MKKLIIVNAKTKERKLMTFEEVAVQYEGLLKKEVSGYLPTFEKFGDVDFEDLLQEGSMALWEAYQRYDETKNYAFSTLATHYIQTQFNAIIKARGTQKRQSNNHKVSLDEKISDGEKESMEKYNLLISEHFEDDLLESLLLKEIRESLTEREKMYLLVLIDEIKAARLAEELGISRAAVSKNLSKFKIKIEQMIVKIYKEEAM